MSSKRKNGVVRRVAGVDGAKNWGFPPSIFKVLHLLGMSPMGTRDGSGE